MRCHEVVVSVPSLSTFRHRLKTFFFQQSYLDLVIWLYIWHHSGPWSDFSYFGHYKNYWTGLCLLSEYLIRISSNLLHSIYEYGIYLTNLESVVSSRCVLTARGRCSTSVGGRKGSGRETTTAEGSEGSTRWDVEDETRSSDETGTRRIGVRPQDTWTADRPVQGWAAAASTEKGQ